MQNTDNDGPFYIRSGSCEFGVHAANRMTPEQVAYRAEQSAAFARLLEEGEEVAIYPISRENVETGQMKDHDKQWLWWVPGSDCGQINNAGLGESVGIARSLEEALLLAFGGPDDE